MEKYYSIEDIIKEVIKKLESQKIFLNNVQERKKILIVVNGGNVSIDQVFLELKRISSSYDIGVFMSEDSKEVIGNQRFENYEVLENREFALEYLENSEIVLLPFLTKNTCAKISVGILDNPATYIIGKALLKEKEIVAAYDSCKTKSNTLFGKRLNENIKTLKEYGITFVTAKELGDCILGKRNIKTLKNKKVINYEDLRYLNEVKVEIIKGTVITPLAKETAKEKKIVFEIVN